MSRHLYRLVHKKDSGAAASRDVTEAIELAYYFDNNAMLMKEDDGVYDYIYCSEEAYESIKGHTLCDMVEQ